MSASQTSPQPPDPRTASGLLYKGTGAVFQDQTPYEERQWPPGPRWRSFDGGPPLPQPPDDDEAQRRLGAAGTTRRPSANEVRMVNASILLRRPLLVTGRPGVGKSTLAYRITQELGLGRVLQWPITSRTTLQSGLFEYDVIGRAQAGQAWQAARSAASPPDEAQDSATPRTGVDIGEFIQLGPLGTALLPHRLPRVLLIDELDKGDADLPNDLLTLFEDGWFAVQPLIRVKRQSPEVVAYTADPGGTALIRDGIVKTRVFPIVIMTSNGEREFPEAFMRRCLRLDIPDPDSETLGELIAAHFADQLGDMHERLVLDFMTRSEQVEGLAADQLLNAAHLATSGAYSYTEGDDAEWRAVLTSIWHPLAGDEAGPGV